MADRPKLKNPVLHVNMMDGAEFDIQTLNMDMLKWERTATKHKWPDFRTVPVWWMTFLAWSAMTREGATTAPWELFSEQLCASVRDPDEDDTDPGTAVDPTGPVVGTG